MLRYLSMDIICSEKWTVSFILQIMSKDKYPGIFRVIIEAIIAFIILQIFFVKHAVLKIGE